VDYFWGHSVDSESQHWMTLCLLAFWPNSHM